jgi:transcriptional/translational regulatory protein YebC/TACO1
MFRLLAETLVEEGRPTSLTNPSVNQALKLAVECVESSELAQKLVTRALETAFGVWGDRKVHGGRTKRKTD